jgi:hypothetical protein
MGRRCSTNWVVVVVVTEQEEKEKKKSACKLLVGKPEGKRPLEE